MEPILAFQDLFATVWPSAGDFALQAESIATATTAVIDRGVRVFIRVLWRSQEYVSLCQPNAGVSPPTSGAMSAGSV